MDKFVIGIDCHHQKQQKEIDNCKNGSEKETAGPAECVPNWLIEVLEWINRMEMANSSISITCRLFYKLCYSKLHGAVQPHIVSELVFCASTKTLKLIKRNIPINYTKDIPINYCTMSIPIAEVPPPHYILGFKTITLGFIDAQVLEFIKNILPLVSSRSVHYKYKYRIRPIRRHISKPWCIVPDDLRQLLTILSSLTMDGHGYYHFQHHTLDYVQFLSINERPLLNNKFIDIIVNWLTKPRIDAKPKILYFEGEKEWKAALVNGIKKKFRKSTQPMTFLVHFDYCEEPNFKMENNRTGEVLLVLKENNCFQHINNYIIETNHEKKGCYLLRCPKGTENEWKEEGQKLFNSQMRNVTTFIVNWEKNPSIPWYLRYCFWKIRTYCFSTIRPYRNRIIRILYQD